MRWIGCPPKTSTSTGDEQYPPRMMRILLIYCHATGRFSSRVIEEATWSDIIVRNICGGNLHPHLLAWLSESRL